MTNNDNGPQASSGQNSRWVVLLVLSSLGALMWFFAGRPQPRVSLTAEQLYLDTGPIGHRKDCRLAPRGRCERGLPGGATVAAGKSAAECALDLFGDLPAGDAGDQVDVLAEARFGEMVRDNAVPPKKVTSSVEMSVAIAASTWEIRRSRRTCSMPTPNVDATRSISVSGCPVIDRPGGRSAEHNAADHRRFDRPAARSLNGDRSVRETAFARRGLIASSIPGVVHGRPSTRFGTVTEWREGPRTVVSSGGRSAGRGHQWSH